MKLRAFIKKNAVFFLPLLSGVLLILAYPPYDLEFLIWVALIPLFWFIYKNKSVFWGGAICGVIFFGLLFNWLFATYPFEWLSADANQAGILILLIILYIIQTVFLGLFFGVFAWTSKKLSLFLAPALWIIFEYLRAWGFGILYFGKETLFGPHWTFGNLAYTLHNNTALIQLSDITGIYGISFLIVLVNVGLFLFLKKKNWGILAVVVLVIAVWGAYGTYKSYEAKPRNVEVALLQTNFTSGAEFNSYQRKEVFDSVLNLFNAANEADIIIAPEGFGIVGLTQDTKIAKHLLGDFWRPGQIFLENRKVIEGEKAKSRLFFYDLEKEQPIGYHDKMLLVPNGDFLPYLTKAMLSIYSFNIQHEKRLYSKGDKIEPVQNIGGTICSSILSPNINRKMTKRGAEFLVVVSSDAPFHGSKSLLAQNLAMSKLRAVENRRYFAQATNMGYSFLLNPEGEIMVRGSELGNKILFGDVQFLNKKTAYAKLGDWPVFLSTGILLLTLIVWYNKKRNLL